MTVQEDPTSGTVNDAAAVARSVRARRIHLGLSLAAAARSSGISAPHLSRIESGDRVPAVTILMRLARAYSVSLGELVGEVDESGRGVTIHRRSDIGGHGLEGRTFEVLGSRSPHAVLQPMRVSINLGIDGDPQSHPGEEWIHVESGILEVEVAGQVDRLDVGDSLHFDAVRPHRVGTGGGGSAVFLIVTSYAERRHHVPD